MLSTKINITDKEAINRICCLLFRVSSNKQTTNKNTRFKKKKKKRRDRRSISLSGFLERKAKKDLIAELGLD